MGTPLPSIEEETNCPSCGSLDLRKWLEVPDRFLMGQERYCLLRCSRCTLVWVHDPPGLDEMASHYGSEYHEIVSRGREGGKEESLAKWQPAVHRIQQHKDGGALLDCGCSSGSFLRALSRDRWTPFGVEINPLTAERARETSGAEVFTGDLLEAPFPEESFDVITAFDFLEHVHRPVEALKKARTWLKPEGIFYLQVPNIHSWEARFFQSFWFGLDVPRHLFHFSPNSLSRLFQNAGFREVSLRSKRTVFVEHSFRYLLMAMKKRLGMEVKRIAPTRKPPLWWRSIRKLCRISLIRAFSRTAARAGKGAMIEAVFQRPAARERCKSLCAMESSLP